MINAKDIFIEYPSPRNKVLCTRYEQQTHVYTRALRRLISSSSIEEKKKIARVANDPVLARTPDEYFGKSNSFDNAYRRRIKSSAMRAERASQACFRFGRLRGLSSVHLSPFRSSLITIECARTPTRVRGAAGGGGRVRRRGVRRENFANGRIIKGDSDHVSGTVHTVTSRAPTQWTPSVGTVETGEQRCTRRPTRLSLSLSPSARVMGFTILHSRGKVPIVGLAYRSHFGPHEVRNSLPRDCVKRYATRHRRNIARGTGWTTAHLAVIQGPDRRTPR